MFTRQEAINVIENQIKKQNNANVEKYQEILKKINSMSDEEFENIAKQRIGENATIEMLSNWLKAKMEEHPKNEFIKLNNMVSYHIINETIALHVVPKQINSKQAREGGVYLADSLEKIKSKMQEGSFTHVTTIFAVSDLLIEMLSSWLKAKMEEHPKDEFIKLNNMVSYHIIHETIALHVVPKQINSKQAREGGVYLADALEKIKSKMQEGDFTYVTTIFAVSDLLKLKLLQKNFKDLGFQIEKGNKNFEKMFKNPYQATLSKKFLLSDEWRELKEKFVEGKPTIEEIESKEQLDK